MASRSPWLVRQSGSRAKLPGELLLAIAMQARGTRVLTGCPAASMAPMARTQAPYGPPSSLPANTWFKLLRPRRKCWVSGEAPYCSTPSNVSLEIATVA